MCSEQGAREMFDVLATREVVERIAQLRPAFGRLIKVPLLPVSFLSRSACLTGRIARGCSVVLCTEL